MALGPLAKLAAFGIRKRPAPGQIGPVSPPPPGRPGDDDGGDDDAGRMSFLDHLDELRRRLVAAAISLAVGTIVAFFFIDRIFDFIMRPLYEKLPEGSKLIYTEPTEAFMLKVKIALLAGARDRGAAHRGSDLALHRARACTRTRSASPCPSS